jgi:GT2 family glycosyltransferase
VVDNDSADGTADFVKPNFPEVCVIRNGANVGYGAACNIGVAMASGEFAAILNPDIVLETRWSEQILEGLAQSEGCGAAEGKLLLAYAKTIVNCSGSRMNILGFGCTTGVGQLDSSDTRIKTVSYPSGAAFVVKRDLFARVGGFDEDYFLYYEDVDFGLRLKAVGSYVVYVPGAVAYHHFKSELRPEKILLLERNRWRTIAKNMPTRYFVRCGPLLLASEIALTIYLMVLGFGRSKLGAVVQFLEMLPGLLAYRRLAKHNGQILKDFAELLTDDFPYLVSGHPSMSRILIGKRILTGYYNAFFRPLSKTLIKPKHPRHIVA